MSERERKGTWPFDSVALSNLAQGHSPRSRESNGGCGRTRTCNRPLWRRLRYRLRHAPVRHQMYRGSPLKSTLLSFSAERRIRADPSALLCLPPSPRLRRAGRVTAAITRLSLLLFMERVLPAELAELGRFQFLPLYSFLAARQRPPVGDALAFAAGNLDECLGHDKKVYRRICSLSNPWSPFMRRGRMSGWERAFQSND